MKSYNFEQINRAAVFRNGQTVDASVATKLPPAVTSDHYLELASADLIIAAIVIGLLFACFQFCLISKIKISQRNKVKAGNLSYEVESKMRTIYYLIRKGANSFLRAEYLMCLLFIAVFGVIIFFFISYQGSGHASAFNWTFGFVSTVSFVVGAITSILCGYIGMTVAVYANVRTAKEATRSNDRDAWKYSFNAAFRAGGVMGFGLCAIGLLMLYLLVSILHIFYPFERISEKEISATNNPFTTVKTLFELVAGFGLGGSCIALFGRVGGGIYTKAADVGADLAGKVVNGLPEDDIRNPAVIADNVGDNVGDVAGMGSDLFGSFGEASCAALVVASTIPEIVGNGWPALMFPLYITALGIPVCWVTSYFATNLMPVRREKSVERVLKFQLLLSAVLMTLAIWPTAYLFLPEGMHLECDFSHFLQARCSNPQACEALFTPGRNHNLTSLYDYFAIQRLSHGGLQLCKDSTRFARPFAALCVTLGIWGGYAIGMITEYYTSASYKPVQDVAKSTKTGGSATNIIYGLALGYHSVVWPVFILAIIIYGTFTMLNMFGVALAALGMLSTLATCLTIDVYGPVCDNAGGIAQMAGLGEGVRRKTDALDAAGNTTAAIGKGFAIGSAALVALALFGAFVTRSGILADIGVNLLRPITFAFLLIGAMLPYWFTATTMKSVGKAAMSMVAEVARQFKENPGILTGEKGAVPDYDKCISISTTASLKEMVKPGLVIIFMPILVGSIFGIEAVAGLLAGSLVSAVQMAISQSNSGGAWDNAKKFVEAGRLMDDDGNPITDKTAEEYIAVVVGDTVGDPLKDTSGPALNILMKLMAIIALVFSDFFMTIGPEMNCATKIGLAHQKVHFSGCGILGYAVPSTCLQYSSWADCRP